MIISLVKAVHVGGLVMGFGGAALADYMLFTRCISRPVTQGAVNYIHFLSRIVACGLGILWISGLMLVWLRIQTTPEFAANPKLWAKITIVSILTVNGIVIHKFALKRLEHSIGRRYFDGAGALETAGLMLCASISSMSWMVPFLLGMLPELNYVAPAAHILAVYVALIGFVWAAMPAAIHVATRPKWRSAY
ncbi:MAG: hypothetical protein HC855_08960 [Rhizobiales bacterium]|nr:hypothetical protein [Hyphomicrobiales bacterium]